MILYRDSLNVHRKVSDQCSKNLWLVIGQLDGGHCGLDLMHPTVLHLWQNLSTIQLVVELRVLPLASPRYNLELVALLVGESLFFWPPMIRPRKEAVISFHLTVLKPLLLFVHDLIYHACLIASRQKVSVWCILLVFFLIGPVCTLTSCNNKSFSVQNKLQSVRI